MEQIIEQNIFLWRKEFKGKDAIVKSGIHLVVFKQLKWDTDSGLHKFRHCKYWNVVIQLIQKKLGSLRANAVRKIKRAWIGKYSLVRQ